MNPRLEYVKNTILKKATTEEQVNKIKSLSWGELIEYPEIRGVLENNTDFYFFDNTNSGKPIIWGPMKVNEAIGIVGHFCDIDMQEYATGIAESMAIINRKEMVGVEAYNKHLSEKKK